MAYSFSQLEGIWIQAGGNRAIAPVMAAIALAESGGNPSALNPNDNGGKQSSFGLWQISNGTHNPPASNWSNPVENAKLAIGKLHSQGLSAWGTYDSGAYKRFLSSAAPTGSGQASGTTTAGGRGSGGVSGTPSSPNPGATKTGNTGATSWFGAVIDGLKAGFGISQQSGNEVANALAGASDLTTAQGIMALTLPFIKMANWLDWFFVPSHWIRIICGIGGAVLVPMGLVTVVRDSKQDGGGMGVAIGIAETGAGAVLLVIAFHNLPSSVKTPGELLGHLQGKVQADVSASTSPATATTAAGAS